MPCFERDGKFFRTTFRHACGWTTIMQARYIQGKMVILASLLASGMALGQGREKLYSNPTAPDAERLAFNN